MIFRGAAQDRFTLKAPNGVAFSEIRGYETWQGVAVSQTDDGLTIIVGNTVMIDAYKRKAFPAMASLSRRLQNCKDRVVQKKPPASPYPVMEPDTLKSVAFIQKDSKRFPETSGWGYAQFLYDAASDSFKPYGSDSSFGKECYGCHTLVKAKDYIFTSYPRR